MISNQNLFCCPVCGEPLVRNGKSLFCSAEHCFDLSKSGYVNLLMSQQGGQHGDDRPMVRARTDFLNGGYYLPLRNCIVKTALSVLPEKSVTVDAGCGEGWYTQGLFEAVASLGKTIRIAGVDISRDALAQAARRCLPVEFAVASLFHIPIRNEAADLVINVFAPESPEEFSRILRPSGCFLKVIPLDDHLMELKRCVYDSVYENPVDTPEYPGFSFVSRTEVRDRIFLPDSQTIRNLFTMTPYYYKTSDADKAKLDALGSLETQISFAVLLYCKKTDGSL